MIGTHRENAHFSRARWRKWVMVPCWIVQIVILLGLMGLFSYRLSHTIETWEEEDNKGTLPIVEFVWEVANIGFSLVSLVVVMVSIARFIAEVLTPLPMLFGCILNLVLSGAVLGLDIVIYIQRKDRNYSIIGLALDATLMLFTIIPLIYAIVIYRRLLAYDDYHIPGNHKGFGFSVEEYAPYRSAVASSAPQLPQLSYDPPILSSTAPTETSEISHTRERSVSVGSHHLSNSLGSISSPTLSLSSLPTESAAPHDHRTAYDHRRDTQFEAYMARRLSQDRSKYRNSLPSQGEIKRALGDEFGFSRLPPPPTDAARINNKGEIVSSGAVHVAHASRPRTSSIGRQSSFEAHLSGVFTQSPVSITPPSEPVTRGHSLNHSLNSVPELREEEEDENGAGPVEGRQPLLSFRNSWSPSARASVSGSASGSRSRSGSVNFPSQITRSDGFVEVELGAKKWETKS